MKRYVGIPKGSQKGSHFGSSDFGLKSAVLSMKRPAVKPQSSVRAKPAPKAPKLARSTEKHTCLICDQKFDPNRNGARVFFLGCSFHDDYAGLLYYDKGQCPGCREWDTYCCTMCERHCGSGLCNLSRPHGSKNIIDGTCYCYVGPRISDADSLPYHLKGHLQKHERI